MKRLFARENAAILSRLTEVRVLLAFDFDGTLAPIVSEPERARMRRRTAALFSTLCRLYPCSVISGRSRADVSTRLSGAAVKYVMGNHGLEPGPYLGKFERDIARLRGKLERALASWPGVDIEDKRYSLALHYRRARQKRLTREAIHAAVAESQVHVRIVPGKQVVNVVPARAPNKGEALVDLRATERADTVLYVGDDVTDEDVFELNQPSNLLTVRVGESRESAAEYFLRSQEEIDRLLAKLVELGKQRSKA